MTTNIESYPNLIDGAWKTLSAAPLEDHNPADYNEIIGLFPMATLDDTKSAIQAARLALTNAMKKSGCDENNLCQPWIT